MQMSSIQKKLQVGKGGMYMKKLIVTTIYMILMLCFSGCGLKNIDTEQADTKMNINVSNVSWSSDFSIPVPKPDTEYIASNDYGTFCYGFDAEQLKEYLKELEVDGWFCIDNTIIEGKVHYTYSNGDMIFQIIDHTKVVVVYSDITETFETVEDWEDSENLTDSDNLTDSYILVNFSYGFNTIKQRENTLPKTEAIILIGENIYQLENTDSELAIVGGTKITMVIERFMEDSFEKMGLQAFTVLNEKGRLVGNYLICNQSVLYVFDSLKDVCVVDIDKDGEYELLSLYGWGSGIYRIELSAYKYVNPIYFSSNKKILQCAYRNCFVPKDGYGKLSLKKISDTEVRLLNHDWLAEDSKEYTGDPMDFGVITRAEDGYHLVPERLEQFPYDQWDYAYDQVNISSSSDGTVLQEIEKSLEEPPLINITVGEKKLNYEVCKTVWNGVESNESISFTELFNNKEEILLFDSPENGLEFKDTIVLDFGDIVPDSIIIKDYLLSSSGVSIYNDKLAMDKIVKIEGNGIFSFGLNQHFAMMLSSNTATYENPSYRGFRAICTFGEDKLCEYVFVLQVSPMW